MNDEILKIIEPQLKNLPEDIKDAIVHNDIGGKLSEIAKKHQLHIDQASVLENETLMVLVGLVSADEYLDNLTDELRVSRDKATEILNDVNKMIFADIRSSLRSMAEQIKKEEEEEEKNQKPTFKNIMTDENLGDLKKDDVLKEIEEPTKSAHLSRPVSVPNHQFTMPKSTSGGLANIGNRLRDRDMNVVTDAKRMDDFRDAAMKAEMEEKKVEAAPVSEAPPVNLPIHEEEVAAVAPVAPIPDKLTEIVKSPRQEIEVKPDPSSGPPKIDPYREAIN